MINNNFTIWYWEYRIKCWNEADSIYETYSGIVAAKTIVEAMENLYYEYGDNIENVFILRAMTENVFDFKTANKDPDFNFEIKPIN